VAPPLLGDKRRVLLSEVRPVSPRKDLGLLVAAASLFTLAMSATSEAQWYPVPIPPPYHWANPESAVRLEVTPKEAEVYVDGYYAGVVDDFDGIFQRLRLPPGEHEIMLYRDGFRSVTQRVYLTPNSTFKIKYRMEPLAPGDVAEPRPVPPTPQVGPPGPPPSGGPPISRGPGRRGPPPEFPPPNTPSGPPPSPGQAANGTLVIRVQPADADVFIDGQPWNTAAGPDGIVVDASEGRHTVQIRKSGYIGYLTEVQIRRGETTPLNVTLRTQP
jgi:hypothetical protein